MLLYLTSLWIPIVLCEIIRHEDILDPYNMPLPARSNYSNSPHDNMLASAPGNHHHDNRRYKRSLCPSNSTSAPGHEKQQAALSGSNEPYEMFHITATIGDYWTQRAVLGHLVRVPQPMKTLRFLPPLGGCSGQRATVADTARQSGCLVAINAGLFNTTSGDCIGNLVSSGRVAHTTPGWRNAHFGITEDGSLFTGYLRNNPSLERFLELVGGVVWLVRDGQNYVETALEEECDQSQGTGSLETFASVTSARTAIGHDREGRVVILQMDGKTWSDPPRGLSLSELADLLISYDVVNAINLDGGGSATMVINDAVVNYPSDVCEEEINGKNFTYNCPREVTSIVCVLPTPCPQACHGRGACVQGACQCEGRWVGVACQELQCGATNCSQHGTCTEDGCVCDWGWWGDDCSEPCPHGWFGPSCQRPCMCLNRGSCDPSDGHCRCHPGWQGRLCEASCDPGRYGPDCSKFCDCHKNCWCDPVSGRCSNDLPDHMTNSIECHLNHYVALHHLVPDPAVQYNLWLVLLILILFLLTLSLTFNLSMFYYLCQRSKGRRNGHSRRKSRTYRTYMAQSTFYEQTLDDSQDLSQEEDELTGYNHDDRTTRADITMAEIN